VRSFDDPAQELILVRTLQVIRFMILTVQEQKQLVCSSVERFFRRLLEEDPANEDAQRMISLTVSVAQRFRSDLQESGRGQFFLRA
jgi:hypothetical protein